MQNRIKVLIPIAIFTLALLVLIVGLITTFFFPRDEIAYENRYANKPLPFSVSSYLDKSFQNSMENALADQVNLAIKSKKLYNILNTAAALPVTDWLQQQGIGYIKFKNLFFYDDYILYAPVSAVSEDSGLAANADEINSWIASCPQQRFYLYYIETDHDVNMETGVKSGAFEYFASQLELPEDNIGRLEINSFEAYKANFMKTDHHWSSQGSYNALCDICAMIGVQPAKASGSYTVYGQYSGTKAAGIEGFPKEDFSVALYNFPPLTITVNGISASDCGTQAQFAAGELETFSYGSVYGGDYAEVCFDTGNEGDNLLILGDSYDNAIIKALSCSFAKTYAVDLRAYPFDADTGFQLDEYVQAHDIDVVLFIGGFLHFVS